MTLKNITPRPSAASQKRPNPPTVRPAASGNPHERRGPSNATTHPTENRGTDPHFLVLPVFDGIHFCGGSGGVPRRRAAPVGNPVPTKANLRSLGEGGAFANPPSSGTSPPAA